MNPTELILTISGLIGITLILSRGAIFSNIKNSLLPNHPKLFEFSICPQCIGFWVGFFSYLFLFFQPLNLNFFINAILFGGSISFLSLLFNKLIN